MLMTMGSDVTGVDPMSVLTPKARQMEMGEMMMDQFMAEFTPGASLTFSFVVPDKPGEFSGIGFTVSLFLAGLELEGQQLADAKLGILISSAIAAPLRYVWLRWAAGGSRPGQ